MQWPDRPIPLGPLYYTFWVLVVLGLLWLPELRRYPWRELITVLALFVVTLLWIR